MRLAQARPPFKHRRGETRATLFFCSLPNSPTYPSSEQRGQMDKVRAGGGVGPRSNPRPPRPSRGEGRTL